jgi:hypothetical protein
MEDGHITKYIFVTGVETDLGHNGRSIGEGLQQILQSHNRRSLLECSQ